MINVDVPATSANCCVGFDSLGLALDFMGHFSFEPSDTFLITGCDEKFAGEDNLVWQAFCLTANKFGRTPGPVHIHIDCQIPLARGLGSSSACTAAGILAADRWFNLQLSRMEMLEIGVELEGHPDNIAPALFGGMCACFKNGDEFVISRLECRGWKGLCAIPDYPIETNAARKILPQEISLKEAAGQCARALVFEAALKDGDEHLMAKCCQDVLHEPYRGNLIPDYGMLKDLAVSTRTPFWISGSGSTMLFFSQYWKKLQDLKDQLEPTGLELQLLSVCEKGAVVYE